MDIGIIDNDFEEEVVNYIRVKVDFYVNILVSVTTKFLIIQLWDHYKMFCIYNLKIDQISTVTQNQMNKSRIK